MKTEINFHDKSKMIPYLKKNGDKLLPLSEYPTSRNARVWASYTDENCKAYTLISYETFPAKYYDFIYRGGAELDIKISPRDLTATTRRHIYAFIRQFVPAKQAQAIINTARITFSLPPMSRDEHTNEPIFEMSFDVYPD